MIQINDKFKPLFFDDTSRYFIVTGGRGSAKSFSVSSFLTGLTFEMGHTILYTRYTLTSAHISIIPEFMEKIELFNVTDCFKINIADIANTKTGNRILFKGIKTSSGNQTASLKSIQGVTTWVLDEAEELTDEEVFDKIDLSVREKNVRNRVILVLNPTTKEHFIYKKFFESKGVEPGFNGVKGDVRYIHTNYIDNYKNLSESFINSIEDMKVRRPEKYKHQILGGWLDKQEGVVYDNWRIGKFDESLPSIFGQDYGYSIDPSTLIEVAIDNKLKRIYVREHFYVPKLTTTEIFGLNRQFAGNKLIIGDSAEPRLIQEIKAKGCNIQAVKKGKDSVITGIKMVQDYDLIVEEDSYNIIKELNNYVWSNKSAGLPVDAYNHALDALRYAVFYSLDKPNRGQYHIR